MPNGSIITQYTLGDRQKAIELFNLKSDAKGEPSVHFSQPIRLQQPVSMGSFKHEAFLKLRKLIVAKKDKERRFLVHVRLLYLQSDYAHKPEVVAVSVNQNLRDF